MVFPIRFLTGKGNKGKSCNTEGAKTNTVVSIKFKQTYDNLLHLNNISIKLFSVCHFEAFGANPATTWTLWTESHNFIQFLFIIGVIVNVTNADHTETHDA